MINQRLKKIQELFPLWFFILGLLLLSYPACGNAAVKDIFDTKEERNVLVYKGDLVSLKVYSLTRIAITTPGIVEIISANVDELLLIGKNVGETPMYIWDEYGKRNITIRVFEQDLEMIIERIDKLFESAEIEGVYLTTNDYEGKIVVTGAVPKDKTDIYNKIMRDFQAYIIDMTNEQGELIQIDAQVSELTTTLTQAFGFDWTTGAEGLIFGYAETVPTFDGSLGDLFKIGDFSRTTQILATVSALIQEGKGRILSKPTVVVTDGEASSFMVGGEIPVVTTSTSSGGTITENITFKNYGVQISVTPNIEGEKIALTLNVSVRDVDSANAVGSNVAFTTTSASTKVSLDHKQTVVIAGLIKHNTSDTLKRVPWLSKIPVIGLLFRYRATPLTDKEVVISLTPSILSKVIEAEEARKRADEADSLLTKEEEFISETEEQLSDILPVTPEAGVASAEIPTAEDALEEEQIADLEEALDEILEDETFPLDVNEEIISAPKAIDRGIDLKQGQKEIGIGRSKERAFVDEANFSDAITAYVRAIQQKISQAISFPYEAKKQGWAGTVKLSLLVLSDGSLSEVNVRESSGHSIFDKDAVNTTQVVAPFAPFPAELDLEEIWVTVPIVYSQEALLHNAE